MYDLPSPLTSFNEFDQGILDHALFKNNIQIIFLPRGKVYVITSFYTYGCSFSTYVGREVRGSSPCERAIAALDFVIMLIK